MKRRLSLFPKLALVATLVGLTGCAAEYDHTEFSNMSAAAETDAQLDRSSLQVPVGMLMTAHVVSYNDDNNIMPMRFRVRDPRIVEVANVISDHDFAFLGLAPGATEVELYAGDKLVLIIAALVTEQPAPP